MPVSETSKILVLIGSSCFNFTSRMTFFGPLSITTPWNVELAVSLFFESSSFAGNYSGVVAASSSDVRSSCFYFSNFITNSISACAILAEFGSVAPSLVKVETTLAITTLSVGRMLLILFKSIVSLLLPMSTVFHSAPKSFAPRKFNCVLKVAIQPGSVYLASKGHLITSSFS